MMRSAAGWILLLSLQAQSVGFASDIPEDFDLKVEVVHFKGDRKPAIFTHEAYRTGRTEPAQNQKSQSTRSAE